MKHQLRSSFSTQGRRMAGARALWTANGITNTYITFLTLLMPPPRRE